MADESARRSQTRIMVALPRDLRERVSKIAREASLSESRIAQELIARALGFKSVLHLPAEQEVLQ